MSDSDTEPAEDIDIEAMEKKVKCIEKSLRQGGGRKGRATQTDGEYAKHTGYSQSFVRDAHGAWRNGQ